MEKNIDIQLLETPLDPTCCETFVSDPEAGGIVVFVGTVRRKTAGREVVRLEFESYQPMAVRQMQIIANQAVEKFSALKISMHHRLGNLEIGGVAVVIAVSTPHRAAAFDACRFCIDELKKSVPIWKKEVFADGEIWVASHP